MNGVPLIHDLQVEHMTEGLKTSSLVHQISGLFFVTTSKDKDSTCGWKG